MKSGELAQLESSWDHLFVDASVLDPEALRGVAPGKITLLLPESSSTAALIPDAVRFPLFSQQNFPTTDTVRFLYLYLQPKRLAGVTALSEKGSVVVGEKLQSLSALGSLADKACAYLEQLDGFELKGRLLDLRVVLPALVIEAFRSTEREKSEFSAVDFQLSASAHRMAINLRFPAGGISSEELRELILSGRSLAWRQAWECSDQFVILEHEMHRELEVFAVLHRTERTPGILGKTLLFRKLPRSGRKENYLESPDGFQFQILSEIRLRQLESVEDEASIDELAHGIDFGSMPEATANKVKEILEGSRKQTEELAYKDSVILRSQERNLELDKALTAKRAELINLGKVRERETYQHEKELKELRRLLRAQERAEQAATVAADAKAAKNTDIPETLRKLELALQASEERVRRITEDLKKSDKNVTLLENRLKDAHEELRKRTEEVFNLKAINVNLRNKEPPKQVAPVEDLKAKAELEGKVKAAEEKALNLAKENRRLQYKVDTNEKNVKAIQEASLEKNKLMEAKLAEAKTKEVELRKRIEDLTAMLKKAKVA